jgi:hypothetical protein
MQKLVIEWSRVEDKFFERLKKLGKPLSEKYRVSLTRYGTGGSYGRPNFVEINIDKGGTQTLAHEIVHSAIDELIEKFEIEHWTKERLVDLCMDNVFPDENKHQQDPKNAQEIASIFDSYFPDIDSVVKKVAELEKS